MNYANDPNIISDQEQAFVLRFMVGNFRDIYLNIIMNSSHSMKVNMVDTFSLSELLLLYTTDKESQFHAGRWVFGNFIISINHFTNCKEGDAVSFFKWLEKGILP